MIFLGFHGLERITKSNKKTKAFQTSVLKRLSSGRFPFVSDFTKAI
jgi:hypothetical protein